MKSVAFHNLGCKVNSYELDVMQQKMVEKGFCIVPFSQKADIYVINTCTVTNIADRKSRQMLHRAKQMNPEAIVVAVGCYVQTAKEKALQDEAIDLCIGNNRKKDIVEIIEEYIRQRAIQTGKPACDKEKELQREAALSEGSRDLYSAKTLGDTTVIDINHTNEYEEMTLKQTAEHTRAYIKIQDGCNQFCTYCAIPLARGRVRSRRVEDILAEVRGMVASGYREIVLTGIHISSYGVDFGEKDKLIDLVEMLQEIPGLERIRMGSLEPRIVTDETAKRLGALSKLCPHFHLSLQSGCDATLKRMNRRYTAAEYAESVAALREVFDNPAITTDVIVGFPGETEEEFETTKAFLEKIGFFEMHIFKYSKREGTKAAVMDCQIPETVKTQRSNVLLDMERRQSLAFRKKYLQKEAEVLMEEEKEIKGMRYLLGHTKDYVKIAIPATNQDAKGRLMKVAVKDILTEEILLGNETDIL